METKHQINLDELKSQNPFKVPEGYMKSLRVQIMSRIPEHGETGVNNAKVIPIFDRIRPLLYLAAVFAGLIVLMQVLLYNPTNAVTNGEEQPVTDNAVYNTMPKESNNSFDEQTIEEEEFLEYMKDAYYSNLVSVALDNWD
jgi:hypothetical protein